VALTQTSDTALGAQFDLAFANTKREIEQALDRAIDRDLATDAIVRELAERGDE
jgi:hypothetical protein